MSQLLSLMCFYVVAHWNTEAARILAAIPTPSISHQMPFRPLTQELARRGHEVVVITTDPAFPKGEAPANLTEIDVHRLSYETWRNAIATHTNRDFHRIGNVVQKDTVLRIFEKQTAVAEVKDIIENKNNSFDLLMLEAWLRFALGYSQAVNVPVITMSSFGACLDNYDTVGGPTHALLYPQPFVTRVYDLSMWEKIHELYKIFCILHYHKKEEAKEYAVVRRIFGDDTPALRELQKKVNLLFLNIHPVWEGNYPVPTGVVYMAGIDQKPDKDLPQDLKEYLDYAAHGVIYLSFGTNIETSALPAAKIQAIINAFSQLPYDVLWKWNQDELPGRTDNIKISKWFPQSDVLKHPNIKLFITQGGLQSTMETIIAGVPVIGIPMRADQWYNVEKYEHLNIGKKVYFDDLNEGILKSAVKTVIENKSYRENVIRLRTLMYDQPMTSLERATWWTEHALRHGTRHLRAPAANMDLMDYYELHLVLTVLTITVVLILLGSLVLYNIVKLMIRFMRSVKMCVLGK